MGYLNYLIAILVASLQNFFTSKELAEGFIEIQRVTTPVASAPEFVIGGSKGVLDTNSSYVLLGYALNYKADADGATVLFKDVASSVLDAEQRTSLRRLYENGTHNLKIVNASAIPTTPNRVFQFSQKTIEGFYENFLPASKLIAFSGKAVSTFEVKAGADVSEIGSGIACLDLILFRIPNVDATFTNSYETIDIA